MNTIIEMKIETSIDWNKVQLLLHRRTLNLLYRDELNKMIDNIGTKVTKLSKAEVEYRRHRANSSLELLEDINSDIEVIEEYIVVAALLG